MSKNIFLIIYDGKIIKNLYYTLLLLYSYYTNIFLNYRLFQILIQLFLNRVRVTFRHTISRESMHKSNLVFSRVGQTGRVIGSSDQAAIGSRLTGLFQPPSRKWQGFERNPIMLCLT